MKAIFNGTLKEFKKFTKSELKLDNWEIQEKTIKDRYDCVKKYSYINKLNDIAKANEILYDECETISWLDSQSIILKVITSLEK